MEFTRTHTSSHCIAVVSLWAIKTAVRLFARDFKALNISDSVVLSSALVASSQSLTEKEKKGIKNIYHRKKKG